MQKPTSVSVIGWFFIIIGGLSLLSGFMALFVSISQEMLEVNFALMVLLQFIVATFAVVGGIGFLKGKKSMRYLLEGIAWFLLSALILFYAKIAPNFSSEPFAIAIVVINFCIFSIPIGLVIYFIRGSKVAKYLECNKAI